MLRLLSKNLFSNYQRVNQWIFEAGGYVQLEAPSYEVDYKDFDIGNDYSEDWDRFKVWDHKSITSEPVVKA